MDRYQVLLNGQNFLMDIEGKISKKGFYASRIVQASSEEEAQRLAMEMIVTDKKLNAVVRNTPLDSPNIFVDEVTILKTHISIQEKEEANKVYMFYPED